MVIITFVYLLFGSLINLSIFLLEFMFECFLTWYLHNFNLFTDARREARKAFLALSSDNVSAEVAVFEGVESDLQNVRELPANDDHKSSESTPVSVFPG